MISNNTTRRFLAAVLVTALMIITQTGCAGKSEGSSEAAVPVSKDSFYFDTICSIAVFDMDDMSDENARNAIDAAFAACAEYEGLLSRTKEGSDIRRINEAKGEIVDCDPRTAQLLTMSLPYCAESEGKFDVTIGRISTLWDFHAEKPAVPSAELIESGLASINYKNVEIGEETAEKKVPVRLADPEAMLDLGAVAKGYIADRICEVLREEGVTSAIVSLGGNISCVGAKPSGDGGSVPFSIGVETPFSDRTEILGTIPCDNGTVVTSGIYERCFEENGKLYHHILDANTGYPCETDVIGVTIVSGEGKSMDCDALATVCLLLGSEKGKALVERTEGVEALFVTEEGISMTSGMAFERKK